MSDSDFYDEDVADDIYEEEDDLHDEDFSYNDIKNDKESKKELDIEFKVFSADEIARMQSKEVSQVSSIIGIKPSLVGLMLSLFRWNKEKLIEAYMEDSDKLLSDIGILDPIFHPDITTCINFECDICCNNDKEQEAFSLACSHRYCLSCYRRYITQKIIEEGETNNIRCPSGCRALVDPDAIKLVIEDHVFQKYQKLILKSFVEGIVSLKWCPAPNCENIVECRIPSTSFHQIVPTVKCKCEFSFCFNCLLPDHLPIPCFLMKKWLKKCADDSETSNWISANTKECTICKATIEKNGGCNHMTCRKCKHEFCWVCLGPWSSHGTQYYNCNKFDENAVAVKDALSKSRAQLERYLHYFNRYANHDRSAKLEKDLIEKTEKKMEEVQQTTNLSWIEVQFFKKAVDVLVQCRVTLKFTYAFAFYLIRSNMTEIFESNQRDLEIAVENLSELLEKPIVAEDIPNIKQAVLDKTVYVSSRRNVVLMDTAKGLLEDRWCFLSDDDTNTK